MSLTENVTALAAAAEAIRMIPPAWPLAANVAVNPFLGQTGERLAETAARLERVAGARLTMPRSWYAERIAMGIISDDDLSQALAAAGRAREVDDIEALKRLAMMHEAPVKPLPTLADIVAGVSGTAWPDIIADRISAWASGYFDEGQALWAAPSAKGAYRAWRDFAIHDLTPEILGLSGFAGFVDATPETADGVIAAAAVRLELPPLALSAYFHRLLMTLGGWSQLARYRLWQAELQRGDDTTLRDLLAITLVWETALFRHCGNAALPLWQDAVKAYGQPVTPAPAMIAEEVLQEAAERAGQRELAARLAASMRAEETSRPALQAVFCIDVRSEIFRRALEASSSAIRTLGFAGFFGLPAAHRRFASDVSELRLPVLLNPGVYSCSGADDDLALDLKTRFAARAARAWGRFKLAAVSSFAFVEAMGPVYFGKLLRDSLARKGRPSHPEPMPRLMPPLDTETRIVTAETILRAMSLTAGFARLVLIVGHGANVVNNPLASALHCGACGGYSGEVNARLLAALLNDSAVRLGLRARAIDIPDDTLFLAALHDTTRDDVTLYRDYHDTSSHHDDIRQAEAWLSAAGRLARTERARRLPGAEVQPDIAARSRDWAEIRPEWALAGCRAFIAAPRSFTHHADLAGRAFLHDYDWRRDRDFSILELILTAPVVVASWISLQYYGSTVAPDVFGCGNKLLHNVAGGIGVIEGNGGMLRAGLAWQSVHDGETYAHEPLRLTVCIAAPQAAINDILARHDAVRALFDNRWLHLLRLDDEGRMAARYEGAMSWSAMADKATIAVAA